MTVDKQTFIRESNAIEGVHDDDAVTDSLAAIEYLEAQGELTHETLKRTHKRILQNRQPEIAGKYRDCQVYIGDDIPPSPAEVPLDMDQLLEWEPCTPLEAVQWHVAFEQIHPFADGNGRIGRLVYYWQCTSQLNATPILWRAADREGYYELFNGDVDVAAKVGRN